MRNYNLELYFQVLSVMERESATVTLLAHSNWWLWGASTDPVRVPLRQRGFSSDHLQTSSDEPALIFSFLLALCLSFLNLRHRCFCACAFLQYETTRPLKASKLALMGCYQMAAAGLKFSKQTGQQELVAWSKRDARLSLNFLALPKYRDEGRASINHWRLQTLFLPTPQGCPA